MSRRKKVKKNEAFFLSGPPTLRIEKIRVVPRLIRGAKGLRVLKAEMH